MHSKGQNISQSANLSPVASPTSSLFDRKKSADTNSNRDGGQSKYNKPGFTLKMNEAIKESSNLENKRKVQWEDQPIDLQTKQELKSKKMVSDSVIFQSE